jgi:hypothetical protein
VRAALAPPPADTEAMQLHFEEVSINIAVGAMPDLRSRRRAYHPSLAVPETSRCSGFLRARRNSIRGERLLIFARQLALHFVFEIVDDIIDVICDAWDKLTAQLETRIFSLPPGVSKLGLDPVNG